MVDKTSRWKRIWEDEKLKWYVLAAVGVMTTGTLGPAVRSVSDGNDEAIIFGRYSIGFICMAIAILIIFKDERKGVARIKRKPLILLFFTGICLAYLGFAYVRAIQLGSLAEAGFLLYSGPLIATAVVARRENLSLVAGALLGCAVLGTLLITGFKLPWNTNLEDSVRYGILAGLLYGLYLYFNNQEMQQSVLGRVSAFYQFFFAALVMVPLVVYAGTNLIPKDFIFITIIGVIHGFAALSLVISALKYLETNEYGSISYLEPATAAIIGFIFCNETLSIAQAVGCAIILFAGVARARLLVKKKPPQKPDLDKD
jgi:drug/metabolite transporter (DMT)-like permease